MKITFMFFFQDYESCIGHQVENFIKKYRFEEGAAAVQRSNKAAAVYSSKISGSRYELADFLSYEVNKGKNPATSEMLEIEDLYKAYEKAGVTDLNEKNFKEVHRILSRSKVFENDLGAYRKNNIVITAPDGPEFRPVDYCFIEKIMKGFYEDLEELLHSTLSVSRSFYHAALMHLRFLHIQPFTAGNHEMARLLEKWFLAQKLGKKFWQIQSEKFYFKNLKDYIVNCYLGDNFDKLNYDYCVPFLAMLPNSMSDKINIYKEC